MHWFCCALTLLFVLPVRAQIGARLPSETTTAKDSVTGVEMTILTDGKYQDLRIYQTHPQWTADGKWIVFRSADRDQFPQAYAVNEASGEIVQLTQGSRNLVNTLNLARKSMRLFFLRNTRDAQTTTQPTTVPTTQELREGPFQIIELDLEKLFADIAANAMKPASSYERICATLPTGLRDAGGFGLDANEDFAYMGVSGGDTGTHLPASVEILKKPEGARMGAGPGGLRSFNLSTGEMKVIIDTPFQMGHVQTNPYVPGEIIYCWETGGDAPQRMWAVNADGSNNRPLFVEGRDDWVTHEIVVSKDEVMFNLIGHQSRLRARPTGIAVINLRTNAMEILGQLSERDGDSYGGFWHCNGSSDGKWAVGDTFLGNVWLISRETGKRTLLTTDHKMKPDHCHPNFSPDNKRILIQSGHFTNGERLQLIVIPIPNELLS